MALIKTKHMNRFKVSILDALLVMHSGLPTDHMHYVPDPDMLKNVYARMFYDSSTAVMMMCDFYLRGKYVISGNFFPLRWGVYTS